jgi:3-hydroxyisobutyrate dehydrogenase-like beta-hydroxyacid dehydrogenase
MVGLGRMGANMTQRLCAAAIAWSGLAHLVAHDPPAGPESPVPVRVPG